MTCLLRVVTRPLFVSRPGDRTVRENKINWALIHKSHLSFLQLYFSKWIHPALKYYTSTTAFPLTNPDKVGVIGYTIRTLPSTMTSFKGYFNEGLDKTALFKPNLVCWFEYVRAHDILYIIFLQKATSIDVSS